MAELSLAVLPLVISALEHFSTVRKAVSRYRNFSEYVDGFFAELDVQCRIFHTSVQLLLTAEVGDEQAVRMVADVDDLAWWDSDLDAHLSERFSHISASSVENCLFLIRQQIKKLLESSGWGVDSPRRPKRKLSLKEKFQHMGKKIDLVCSQGQNEALLRLLRDRTRDFRILVQQTEKLTERAAPTEPSRFARAKVERFAAVKSAADDLYTAFGQACTKHTEHRGYIGLQPTSDGSDHVNFVLAFRSLQIQGTSTTPGPEQQDLEGIDDVWLTIESEVTGVISPLTSAGILGSLNKSTKRAREASPSGRTARKEQENGKKHEKRVSFQVTSPAGNPSTLSAAAANNDPTLNPLLNLCVKSNFCNEMKTFLMESNQPVGRCIGYLETNRNSKHLIYVHSRMGQVSTNKRRKAMRALSQLLRESSRSTDLGGPLALLRERVRVGKQLALALLQFHETCWLKDFWSSDDIVVSEKETCAGGELPAARDSAQASYADVSIRRDEVTIGKQRVKPLPYVRNRALFSLGKILLELAYRESFDQLKRPEDVDPKETADSQDFFTAKRLLLSVSSEMGLRYAEVARKCIECDFGQGDDLASERLQAGFYEYVICELERSEQLASDL